MLYVSLFFVEKLFAFCIFLNKLIKDMFILFVMMLLFVDKPT